MDALRHELGDETFFKLLRLHYERNRFGVATSAGFQQEAAEVAGRPLQEFFKTWLQHVVQ